MTDSTTIPVPNYGDTVVDASGNSGVAKYNPNTGSALPVPTTVPGSSIVANPAPLTTPTPSDPDGNLKAWVTSTAQNIATDQTNDTTAETKVDQGNNTLNNLMLQLGGQAADTSDAENKAGLPTMDKELTDLQALQTQQLGGYINTINKNDLNATGETRSAQNGDEAQISRQHGIDALLTSGLIQAKQGSITAARATVDRAIAAKYDPIKNAITVQNSIIQQNMQNLSRADQKLADEKLVQNNLKLKQIDDAAQNEKDINAIKLEVAKNGAPNSVLSLMGNAKTVDDALVAAKGYLSDPMDRAIKNQQLIKLKADNQAALGLPTTGANGALVNTILASGKFTKDQATEIRAAVSTGQDPLTVVKNQAKNIMTGATATKLESYENSLSAIKDLNTAFQDYYNAGGDTGLLSGNFEKVFNKLGAVNDPKLVEVATQAQIALQAYRNAISGTAYSDQEGKDIASVFPSIKNGEVLNNAIVAGRVKSAQNLIDGIYSNTLGSAYTDLKNQSSSTLTPKGKMDDKTFVENSLTSQGVKYTDYVASTPPNQIPVVLNGSGQLGYIPESEFNKSVYTRI